MTGRTLLVVGLALMAACSREEKAKADSADAALPTVDTLKRATDTLPAPDSLATKAAGTTTGAKTVVGSKTSGKTGTKRDSTIIGRDSVTPYDPTKKPLPPAKRP